MKTIMVDMDNVITDGNFEEYLNEFLGRTVDLNTEYNYFRQELIEGREDEFKSLYEYKNLYENAPLIKDCYEVLKKLSENYKVYIVTAYIWKQNIFKPEENLKNKFLYLQEQLPFIPPVHYIFTENKSLMHFDIKIDDRVHNLENGDMKLLFATPSNRRIPEEELKQKGIIRVENWKEIERILL